MIKSEEVNLKSFVMGLGTLTVTANQDIQKNQDVKSRRKNFDELTSAQKQQEDKGDECGGNATECSWGKPTSSTIQQDNGKRQ